MELAYEDTEKNFNTGGSGDTVTQSKGKYRVQEDTRQRIDDAW